MNTYIYENARFTAMRDGVIRIEYAENGQFIDDVTFFARRNALFDADFELNDGTLTVKTDKITLTYKGGEFTADTLYAEIHTGGKNALWHYGDTLKNNLGGTLTTLDEVKGFVPVPDGLLSRDGFYVIDDSGRAVFAEGWAHSRDEAHKVDIYLFAYGTDYQAAMRDFAAVSGKIALPRKYFMGSWYSRWHYYSAEDYINIAKEYKTHDFPIDIMVVDLDWHHHDWNTRSGPRRTDFGYSHADGNFGWTGYTWCEDRFPDPKGMFDKLHEMGLAVTLSDHPADGVRDCEEMYPEFMKILEDAGYEETVPDNEELFDLEKHPERKEIVERHLWAVKNGKKNFRFNAGSKVYMDAFFNTALKWRDDEGVDFWWMDWQQDYIYPEVHGIKGLTHTQWLNELYFERSREGGTKRGINFSRWGGFGDQRHPGNFSGDITVSFEGLAFEVQMTVSSGNAGCFWWTHDIGGFFDPETPKQAECYARWAQFGAVSSAMRIHCCGEDNDRRPWLWGEPYCSSIRTSFHLRSRLFPYIYSSAYYSSENCVPLLRPLYWDTPELEESYNHPAEYMYGNALLVSPVITAGKGDDFVTDTEVWLPEGEWYGWFDGRRYASGNHTVTNGLFTFPMFVKAGMPFVTRKYTDRMASAPLDEVEINLYAPNGDFENEFILYEDDGISEVENTEMYRKTKITAKREGGTLTFDLCPEGNGYDGEPETRKIVFRLHGFEKEFGCASASESSYNKIKELQCISFDCIKPDAKLTVKFTEC